MAIKKSRIAILITSKYQFDLLIGMAHSFDIPISEATWDRYKQGNEWFIFKYLIHGYQPLYGSNILLEFDIETQLINSFTDWFTQLADETIFNKYL